MPPYPRRARRLLRTPAAPRRREHPPPAIEINPVIGRNLGSTYTLACTYDPVGGEPLPSGDGGTSPAPSPLGRPFGYFKFMSTDVILAYELGCCATCTASGSVRTLIGPIPRMAQILSFSRATRSPDSGFLSRFAIAKNSPDNTKPLSS